MTDKMAREVMRAVILTNLFVFKDKAVLPSPYMAALTLHPMNGAFQWSPKHRGGKSSLASLNQSLSSFDYFGPVDIE